MNSLEKPTDKALKTSVCLCSEASTVPEDEEALCRPVHTLMPHLQRAQLFLQRKEAKLEQRRAQLQQPLPSFRPSLCPHSRRLTRSHSPLPKPTPAPTFRPHINARSRQLQRPGSTVDRLYRLARKQLSASPLTRTPPPLQHSRELIQRKLASELQQATASPSLSYSQLREVLQRLGMATAEDRELCYRVWTRLSVQGHISLDGLRSFLLDSGSSSLLRELHLRRLTQIKVVPAPMPPPGKQVAAKTQRRQMERLATTNSSQLQSAKEARERELLRECTFTPLLQTPADCLRRLSQDSRHEKLYKLAAVLQMCKLTVPPPPSENWSFTPQLLPRSASVLCALPKRAAETVARLSRAREEAAWRDYRRTQGLNNTAVTERLRAKWRVRSVS